MHIDNMVQAGNIYSKIQDLKVQREKVDRMILNSIVLKFGEECFNAYKEIQAAIWDEDIKNILRDAIDKEIATLDKEFKLLDALTPPNK